jgi:hypothetical protein
MSGDPKSATPQPFPLYPRCEGCGCEIDPPPDAAKAISDSDDFALVCSDCYRSFTGEAPPDDE